MEARSAGGRPPRCGGAVGSWYGPVGAVLSALLAGNSAVAATVEVVMTMAAAATVAAGAAATVAAAVVVVPAAVATVVQSRTMYDVWSRSRDWFLN